MRRLRAAVKLAGIAAVLAAIPAILYATAGNPLPAWPVDWGLVAESLSTGAIATSTWLQVVAVAGWLVWSYLIVALTVDVVATVGNRPSPVGAAPVQWLASTIVALATQLSTVNLALAPTPATIDVQIATSYDPAGTDATSPVGEDAPEGTHLIVVSEGDSWAGFAQTAVGDAAAGPQIRMLNDGRDVGGRVLDGSEAFVEAGWQLLVPAAAAAATPLSTAGACDGGTGREDDDQQAADAQEAPVGDETWTVEEGEHFWSIAETTVEATQGAPPSEREVASYWQKLIDANEDRLLPPEDPDLIYPGQTLIIPPVDATAAATARAEPDADEPPPDIDKDEDPVEHAEPELPDRTAPQPGSSSDNGSGPAATDEGTADADETGTSTAIDDQPGADGDVQDDGSETDDVEVEPTAWGTPAGLATGTAATMLLAGGVLTLLHRRRRIALQQRPVQVRLPPLTDEQIAQAARLDAAAAPGEVLDEFADLLCSIPDNVDPVLVAANDDGSVTLTFEKGDGLPTPPPAPWVVDEADADEVPRWAATLGARGPRRSIGLPLLVTLGRHETATVLGNVAAMRLLAVDGDVSEVGRQLRAFALEVATSRTAGPLQVSVAGDTASTMIDQLRRTDDPDTEVAAAADEVAQGIIAEDRLPRLIVCHEAAAVPRLPENVDLVGVITADEPTATDARWRLHLEGHRRVLHQPGGRYVVLDSPDFDPDLVTDELAALDVSLSDVPAPPPADPTDEVTATAGNSDSPEEHGTEPPGEVRPQQGWCEVGVLGRFTVTCGGTPLDTLSQTVGEVLAYLAAHPKTTSELLEDAVWAGQAAGSGNRVRSALTRLRSELGTTPDGEALVPRRGPREQTIRLSPEVTTDLDRAFAHLDAADRIAGHERLDQLLAALNLVRGTPFEDMPVSWATDIAHRAVARLQDAALVAATELLAAGQLDDAERAVVQGLKLFDPCEPLYVVWAQIEDARDRRHRIPQLWTRLRQRYADEADETFDIPTTPTAATEQAFAALTGRGDAHT